MKNYNEENEKLIVELVRQKEESDRNMLNMEIVIGILSMIILFAGVFTAAFVDMVDWLRIVLIIGGFVPCIVGLCFALRIEQKAGYYECAKCHHKYVPDYKSVLFAMHINRTRYMKCPHCNEKSWQKKVISKD